MSPRPLVVYLIAFGLNCVVTTNADAAYTFTTIDVPGATSTNARGINDRSQVVGSFSDGAGTHGFLRSGGTFTTIDVPGARSTSAYGINNRGQIVGEFTGQDSQIHAFLLDNGLITVLDPPGATASSARSINDLGQGVGVSDGRGVLWTHGTFATLTTSVAATTQANGINGAGQIVGSLTLSRDPGFRLEPSGSSILVVVPETGLSQTNGINLRGEIVGQRQSTDGIRGFLLAYGTFTTINVPDSAATAATGINARGQIVGIYSAPTITSPVHGFIATPLGVIEDVSGTPDASGTRVPLRSLIVDNALAIWTLGPGQEILRGGVQVAGGYGSQILWYQGSIYVLGDDSNWWRWTGSTWAFAGSNDPSS